MNARLILACLIALPPLHAAEKKKPKDGEPPPPPAHLLFVNAVEDRGLAFVVLDGQDVQRRGFHNGQVTGWLGVASGARQVRVEHEPLGIVEKESDLAPGSHHALIAHNHSQPQPETGRPPRPAIGVLWVDCDEAARGRAGDDKVPLTVINATSQPEIMLKTGALKLKARRLQPVKARVSAEGSFLSLTLEREEEKKDPPSDDSQEPQEASPLASVNIEEKAAFFVVLIEKTPGEIAAATFSLALPAP